VVIQLIWIAIIYGLAIAIIHYMHVLTHNISGSGQKGHANQYILITYNHEKHIEWYIRALWLYASLQSKELRVTIIDFDSDDETVLMIHRMNNLSGLDLSVQVCTGADDDMAYGLPPVEIEGSTLIDLRLPQEARRIPYVQG
jgi:hypothetical protein